MKNKKTRNGFWSNSNPTKRLNREKSSEIVNSVPSYSSPHDNFLSDTTVEQSNYSRLR